MTVDVSTFTSRLLPLATSCVSTSGGISGTDVTTRTSLCANTYVCVATSLSPSSTRVSSRLSGLSIHDIFDITGYAPPCSYYPPPHYQYPEHGRDPSEAGPSSRPYAGEPSWRSIGERYSLRSDSGSRQLDGPRWGDEDRRRD
jgi:hypothetical protein